MVFGTTISPRKVQTMSNHSTGWSRLILLLIATLSFAYSGCAGVRSVQFSYADDYRFEDKKVGVMVVLVGEEQGALDQSRVARRAAADDYERVTSTSSAVTSETAMSGDLGTIKPPPNVRSLSTTLTHRNFYDRELIEPVSENIQRVFEAYGYSVEVVPAPNGPFEFSERAQWASAERGCDLIALTLVTVVRSWNVEQEYWNRSSQRSSASFQWQLQTGGLVALSMTVFDIRTNKIVWEHDRREINTTVVGPLFGATFDERKAWNQDANSPSEYQALLYRESANRAISYLFANDEKRFMPLPFGSGSVIRNAHIRRYELGEIVLVRPSTQSTIWHIAKIVADNGGASVDVEWYEGMWSVFASNAKIPKTRVTPLTEWPPIVWVRDRDRLQYTPYRFERYDSIRGYVFANLAGAIETQTFLVGRVGIIPIPENGLSP